LWSLSQYINALDFLGRFAGWREWRRYDMILVLRRTKAEKRVELCAGFSSIFGQI
jgi:hypothetical protein